VSSQIPTDRLTGRLVQSAAVTAAGIGIAFLALCEHARLQAVISLIGWVLAVEGIGWALRRRRIAEALAGFALFVGVFIQGFLWICPEGGLRAGTVLGVGGLLVFGLLIAAGGTAFDDWGGDETEFDRQLRNRPRVYPWSP
jgi:hypothetical protein